MGWPGWRDVLVRRNGHVTFRICDASDTQTPYGRATEATRQGMRDIVNRVEQQVDKKRSVKIHVTKTFECP
jgi:hypothetical protein